MGWANEGRRCGKRKMQVATRAYPSSAYGGPVMTDGEIVDNTLFATVKRPWRIVAELKKEDNFESTAPHDGGGVA